MQSEKDTLPWRQDQFDPGHSQDYHESARASRVIAASPERPDWSGQAGVRERKVRTPQGSVLANGEGWRRIPGEAGRTPPIRKVPQKIYRLLLAAVPTRLKEPGKGEKVRPRSVGD